jgi:membrane protein DedA with SNARE-associated domain
MVGHVGNEHILGSMAQLGDFGIFVAMFLESSIIPIPSEVVILGAGAMGFPLASILVFGALGSTAGAMVGYLLGRYAALPVILRFGKYMLIKPHHIYKAEAFAKKYGAWSVLIGRLVPIVPFKVFSITAGITNISFPLFVIFTLIGVVPRIYLLTLFGYALSQYTKPALLVLFFVVLTLIAFKLTRMIYNGRGSKNKE